MHFTQTMFHNVPGDKAPGAFNSSDHLSVAMFQVMPETHACSTLHFTRQQGSVDVVMLELQSHASAAID
jgi:hypothetical protein